MRAPEESAKWLKKHFKNHKQTKEEKRLMAQLTSKKFARMLAPPEPVLRPLTPTQAKVLSVFIEHRRAGYGAPTLRELCKRFGWSSTAAARDHIKALVTKGALVRPKHGRPGAVLP